MVKDTLVCLLAGGEGERLLPLTRDRAKPAVPFGGIYRIIDITLSNCINSGLRRVYVLTQYKALSLNRHLREGWSVLTSEMGEFVQVLPPMKRVSDHWYQGTADAVYQNLYSIGSELCKYVLVLSGDHVYKMNYQLMLQQHADAGAEVTVAPWSLTARRLPISAWSNWIGKDALWAGKRNRRIQSPRQPSLINATFRWASIVLTVTS